MDCIVELVTWVSASCCLPPISGPSRVRLKGLESWAPGSVVPAGQNSKSLQRSVENYSPWG